MVNHKSRLDNCGCAACNADNNENSECVGSYNCTSNLERTDCERKKNTLKYPTTIFVMRHSERVDDMFPGWTTKVCEGKDYKPYDLNMPDHLPIDRPLTDYQLDPPITRTGIVLSQMVGRGLKFAGFCPDVIYCSPALRCLQTAYYAKKMCSPKTLLRVEDGLFENSNLYSRRPVLPTIQMRQQFEVDESYKSIYDFKDIFGSPESCWDYNYRYRDILNRITTTPEHGQGELTVLVIGHASSIDLAVGTLREKRRVSTDANLYKIGHRVPYCSIVCMKPSTRGKGWEPVLGVIPPVTYTHFTNKFDVDFITRPNPIVK